MREPHTNSQARWSTVGDDNLRRGNTFTDETAFAFRNPIANTSKLETLKACTSLGEAPESKEDEKIYEKINPKEEAKPYEKMDYDEEGIYEPIPGDQEHVYDEGTLNDAIVLENIETTAPVDGEDGEDDVYM